MKSYIFKLLAGRVGKIVGHYNLVRIGNFFSRAGRLDIPNSIANNGEAMVQKAILKQLDGNKAVIVDCGANIGQWSTQLVTTFSDLDYQGPLKLFCFEPSSYTYSKLSKAMESLQSEALCISTTQSALSSASGHMDLKIVHEGAGTNSLVDVPGSYSEVETVQVTTLDEFAVKNGLGTVDLLKIDAEGYDFEVILGAEKLLKEQRIQVIQFEYNWRWIYGNHFLKQAFEYLVQRGYSIGKITPDGIQFYSKYDVQLESFIEGNYIACLEQWKCSFDQVPSWLD